MTSALQPDRQQVTSTTKLVMSSWVQGELQQALDAATLASSSSQVSSGAPCTAARICHVSVGHLVPLLCLPMLSTWTCCVHPLAAVDMQCLRLQAACTEASSAREAAEQQLHALREQTALDFQRIGQLSEQLEDLQLTSDDASR